jgi:hypothetical protein
MFDPTKPVEGTPIDAAELRSQFTGLADMIAAVPVGPAGPTGPEGPPGAIVNAVTVDFVSTGAPGGSASAFAFVDPGGIIHFTFDIPQGIPGEVSQAQLNNDLVNAQNAAVNQSLSFSSSNSNSVPTLDNAMADAEVEMLRQRLNELINALRR